MTMKFAFLIETLNLQWYLEFLFSGKYIKEERVYLSRVASSNFFFQEKLPSQRSCNICDEFCGNM